MLRNIFQLGLFENPYLDVEKTAREVGNAEDLRRGFEAQLKSIVMLKNKNGVIHAANSNVKPTVYIPMVYRDAIEVKVFHSYEPASWTLPVDINVAQEYFNVVTDTVGTLSGKDKDGKPMALPADIIRLAPEKIAACDMVLAVINNPIPVGNQFEGIGYDKDTGYIPISLQYGRYVADSPAVRRASIAGDEGENRSYFGKTAQIVNPMDPESVNYSRECLNRLGKNIPIITLIHSDKPQVFSEIEPNSDAILVGYGVSDRAYFDIVTGKFEPQGLLPMQQPRDMITVEEQQEDVPRDMTCYTDGEGNTYDFAFGLNWRGVINDSRTAKYK